MAAFLLVLYLVGFLTDKDKRAVHYAHKARTEPCTVDRNCSANIHEQEKPANFHVYAAP
eukprot:CAMPEP_0194392264 /NCGR_PEP_ID=MMETSP0174-20130528/120631_1 /TAXON_ID=216777 /ORGANISM="Proboscia alata, Strain PI-D3" /LENGTH=58 /DNA_ID=CAMNT_0039187443 /DNA_START=17 /DNA_END=190 /DNA_ORIENTATION=+